MSKPSRRRKDPARTSDTPAPDASNLPRPLLGADGKVDPRALRAASGVDDESGCRGTVASTDPREQPTTPDTDDAVIAPPEDDIPTRVQFKLSRDLKKRLDKYLTDRVPFMSRTQLQRLIDNDAVTVNGKPPKASTVLRIGDVVEAILPPPPPTEIQPEDIPLVALHEDDDLIVINKAPDILVHPARSHNSGTMVNALAWRFRNSASTPGAALSTVGAEFARPGVVHRLDRHTSGVIVFAKRDEAHWRLGHQFERRQVDKRYLAVVHGEMEPLADVIDLPLGPHPSREKGYREKYVVRHDEQGRPSVTVYRVREVFKGFTLVELDLKTGRTHQIRVHLSHLGFPIVGDDMYGGKVLTLRDIAPPHAPNLDEPVISRQALHAATLSFTHPRTNAPMRFTAPAPPDLSNLIALLRAHRPKSGPVAPAGATIDIDAILAK